MHLLHYVLQLILYLLIFVPLKQSFSESALLQARIMLIEWHSILLCKSCVRVHC